jgi:flagellar hook-associated protein 3 FlgL
MEGSGARAGLKQVIAERRQADVGATGLGRLEFTTPPPLPTTVELSEEADPLPFGLKLNAITSSLTGATVAGPAGTPPAISVDFPVNPNPGDKVKFTFDLPDGTLEVIELTASTNTPLKAGEFAIGATSDLTAANFQTELSAAIGKLANGPLVAASAFAASDNFFTGGASTVTGGAELNDNTGTPVAITGATRLAGTAGGASDNLSDNVLATDTIVVNGVTISFNSGGGTTGSATAGTLSMDVTTGDVSDVLAAIDAITGTTIPSTVGTGADAGKVLLQTGANQNLVISGTGLGRLGLSAGTTSVTPPLRVNGPPFDTATTLVAGTPANTVTWYTGETGADPARGTAVARIDQSITVQYGARANEQALRYQVQIIAAYAAVTTASTDPNARAQVQALNDRTAAGLAPQFGQQSIQDIQSEWAGAQGAMEAASDRQTLTTTMTQTMLDGVEGVNNEEVIAKILALQTNLQASYQVTSMLYQTSLVKFI